MSRIFICLFVLIGAMSSVMCQLLGHVGVCNGRLGNNLPSERDVVELYKANGIKRMRIYDPNANTLAALNGSDIELILDVPNVDLHSLEFDATQWVENHVLPYFPGTKIRYIAVGNEIDPAKNETKPFVPQLLRAMENIHKALTKFQLQNQIKVSTATYSAVLKDTFPPSRSAFNDSGFMPPVVNFLASIGSPLLVNIYPYFAYIGDPINVKPEFALFTSQQVVRDNGLEYRNLFDLMVDGVYYAMEKAGGKGVGVVVSESGWPSGGGGSVETLGNAETYYQNLIRHVVGGTPKKKGALETYLFALFDENQKPGKTTEQHFGLFYPNKTPKYNKLGLRSG
ncbi:glucan endo-1,3-beta-glucosidase-like [Salvia hispanica]|uniref:glucan endo-1,3-beta-glucosidase-like n=1 Tax=Salvia hispanica TaxID=49212 RepID=UPI0020093EA1|nr:glucan endo-1,3-beta-glucosidase-like [Salvia hispanica]